MIKNLIKSDIIMLNGKKNSFKNLMILIFISGIAGGIILAPMMIWNLLLIFSVMIIVIFFQIESDAHSEKLLALLPVKRKDIVKSRFLMIMAIYFLISIIFFITMIISVKLHIYISEDIGYNISKSLNINEFTIDIAIFTAIFSFGTIIISISLKKYLKCNSNFTFKEIMNISWKKTIVISVILFSVTTILISGIELRYIIKIYNQINKFIKLYNGIPFMLSMIAVSVIISSICYIRTLFLYEKKEL